jgi:hypothetical protein
VREVRKMVTATLFACACGILIAGLYEITLWALALDPRDWWWSMSAWLLAGYGGSRAAGWLYDRL